MSEKDLTSLEIQGGSFPENFCGGVRLGEVGYKKVLALLN